MATGRLAAMAIAALMMLTPDTAQAQSGLPRVVMIGKIRVEPDNHDAFRAWIAEFRALVESQIAEGRLSPTDVCAYKSWRVLGPDPAGLNQDFLFVFEPVIPIANYRLQHYVDQSLEPEAAREMMGRWSAIASPDPDLIYASPLTSADAVNLGEVCEF